jgi:hypothetical protein
LTVVNLLNALNFDLPVGFRSDDAADRLRRSRSGFSTTDATTDLNLISRHPAREDRLLVPRLKRLDLKRDLFATYREAICDW